MSENKQWIILRCTVLLSALLFIVFIVIIISLIADPFIPPNHFYKLVVIMVMNLMILF